jgi:predicted aspartyl protease
MRVFRVLLLILGLSAHPSFICSAAVGPANPSRGGEVRVDVWNHHIYVPVSVNGSRTLWFLLDTGAGVPVTLIDDKVAASIKLRIHSTHEATAIGGSVKLAVTMPAKLTVGSSTINDAAFAELPLRQQQGAEGHKIDGILGYDFLRRFTVDIDYSHRSLALDAALRPSDAIATRMWIEGKEPHILVTIVNRGEKIVTRVILDTGEDAGLLLNNTFYKSHKNFLVLSRAQLGRGLGGESNNAQSQVEAIEIGAFSLPAIPATVNFDTTGNLNSRRDAGLLGGKVLERLHILLDYAHGRFSIIRHRA